MSDAAIIKATYSEWKMVKTRKVLVLSFEVPLEAQETVQAALGTPMPDAETWVAIARLNLNAVAAQAEPPVIEHQPEPELRKPAKLAQIAGILCNNGAFRKWCGATTVEQAAQHVRDRCNVDSRADLDTHEDAAAAFRDMKGEYEAWMLVAA